MVFRLRYRYQIPLGLSLGVVITALLVTVVAAQVSARTARQEILATVHSAVALLGVQAKPLLAADDTWRVFTLLKSTAALLPGIDQNYARAAVLDAEGRIVAASDPVQLETGRQMLAELGKSRESVGTIQMPAAVPINQRLTLVAADKAITLIDPFSSEDGQVLGFSYVQIDGPAFSPNWIAIIKPASLGALLAVAFLAPIGWLVGVRMARPVARVAACIGQIGHTKTSTLLSQLPVNGDPELNQIGSAIRQLLSEMDVRRQAQHRALSAQRMAAVGRITAAVAHEINNPLGGLLTTVQTLRLHGDSEATRLQSIDLIERGLQQIRTTVAALLPQARVEDRALDIHDLDDVIALVQPYATRFGVVINVKSELSSALRVPSASVRQAMLNLMLNAIKAAGEQGWVNALLESSASTVRFCVGNSGHRLSPEDLEQSIAAESGNDPRGFGLWVCREIASEFAGRFEVLDPTSETTSLIFWIPNREPDVVTITD